ncbi:MAG: transcriptional regulator [Rubritepida sp.]|nr:transcriptional regulator [Rubritepida sp.]
MTALTTFAAVARTGGITAAARDIFTVPSNVTARIKELEHEIGLPLFERHSRGMSLTPSGERLLPYAERLVTLMSEAKQAAQDEGAPSGTLRIGSMETTAAVRLPKILAGFHRAWPRVRLSLRTGPTARLVEAVLAREIEGAFVAAPVEHAELEFTPAFEEELVLVSSPAIRNLAALQKAELAALVFQAGCSYRQRLEQVLTRLGLPAFARLEFGTLEGMLGCVAAGMGVTMLPRAVVEASGLKRDLRCHRIAGEEGRTTTLFIRRRDGYRGRALGALLEMI